MKKKSISLIIGSMSLALVGVVAMQYYFIRESYRLKSQLFDQSVNESLNAVVSALEKRDALLFLKKKAEEQIKLEQTKKSLEEKNEQLASSQAQQFAQRLKIRQQKIDKDFRRRDSLLRQRYPKALVIDNTFYETYFKNPNTWNRVKLQVKLEQSIDAYGRIFQDEVRQLYVENPDPADQQRLSRKAPSDTVHYLVEDPALGFQVISLPKVSPKLKMTLEEEEQRLSKKVNKFLDSIKILKQKTAVFEDLANEYEQADIPLRKRINPRLIDSLLHKELRNRGISLPFNYQVKLIESDSVIFAHAVTQTSLISHPSQSYYQAALFPKELIREAGILTIAFPTRSSQMFKSMDAILASSAGLLLVLTGCFAYTIFIIFRQKKISEMKTDFINNMTHEFKTPVATIMIASEALKDPEVVEDKQRLDRLADIIYDENVRLGNHIERVLNIAKIDRDDLRIEHVPVEMNDLIAAVADSMALQFQKNEAAVNLDLSAQRSTVKGDELHLSNVIFNLLDNALKYSPLPPQINISTYNSGKNLIIKIADKGMGMNRDQLSKIFDQFYRIPTGNLHDVKGFGLGLNYVHNIVKSLNGTIKVKSEKDKGSEFEISLPAV